VAESESAELRRLTEKEYEYGFVTDIESEAVAPGLSEDVVRLISAKKNEPEWLLEFRLKALERVFEMLEEGSQPTWANIDFPSIDYQDIIYYSAPVQRKSPDSLDEVDPELLATY